MRRRDRSPASFMASDFWRVRSARMVCAMLVFFHDASAFSELDYLAIDIHGWSPPHGPIVIELGGPSGHHQSFGHDTLQGEFAQVFAMAEAHGANTLSATLTSALTVENHFSFVNATAMVAL